jgi:serine/threonine-protein kinase HipA
MSHSHRDTVGTFSYEQLVMTARELGLHQDSIEEIFKRAIFNIVGRNQDDHTKNFGFLMNKQGKWSLSPAFDMTYSYDPTGKWTNKHQIRLNSKNDNFTLTDIAIFGKYCNLSEKKSKILLENTIMSFSKFENLATKYNIDSNLIDTIKNNLRTNFTL